MNKNTHYRCENCGVEVTVNAFDEESNLCTECANTQAEAISKINHIGPENTAERSLFIKVLLLIYGIVCLVQVVVSIRWGGYGPQPVLVGFLLSIIFFFIPILIAKALSKTISASTKKNSKTYFTPILLSLIIICCVFLFFAYSFMLTFSF